MAEVGHICKTCQACQNRQVFMKAWDTAYFNHRLLRWMCVRGIARNGGGGGAS